MLIQNYNDDRGGNWKSKDTALYVITSLSAKAVTLQSGATVTNEYIDVLSVFGTHVMPELEAPMNDSTHPIIKVDAIKYLMVFRGQLSKAQLLAVFPKLVIHLQSANYVVYTWAAYCIERILSMKAAGVSLFSAADMSPFASHILTSLFGLIEKGSTPEKLAENDYLMKCVMRVVVATRQDLLPHVQLVLQHITTIITAISKNPSNPKFNHYAFETLASLVRYFSLRQICLCCSACVGL